MTQPRMTRAALETLVRDTLPSAFAAAVLPLIRPSIRLIPGVPDPSRPLASRLGGIPHVPAGWTWPLDFDEEPMIFIGQFDCREFAGLDGAEALPKDGLLAFFGHYETTVGVPADPPYAGIIQHWPAGTPMSPAAMPDAAWDRPIEASLTMAEQWSVPHMFSLPVRAFTDELSGREMYGEITERVETDGVAPALLRTDEISQVLGWARLVQNDFDEDMWGEEYDPLTCRLLLQVDAYHNGSDEHWWGPGGRLYFLMKEDDLRAHRWEAAMMIAQVT
jgi:uncharacterized protein YwqG